MRTKVNYLFTIYSLDSNTVKIQMDPIRDIPHGGQQPDEHGGQPVQSVSSCTQ